ncbi:MAG: C40 family peptidase [Gemmatimonadales bacterium]
MSPAAIARATIAPLLAQPTLRAEQVSQLVLGETAHVFAAEGEWRRVRTHLDGYEGWMNAGYAIEVGADEAEAWRSEAEGWSLGATVNLGEAVVRLPLRARVMVDGDTVRLPDGRRGRLIAGEIPVGVTAITAALNTPAERWAAEHFPGSPYQWGGVTPWGVDCSGLVQTTFAARGVLLPRDASQQVACGVDVPTDATRSGDLLFFRGDATQRITHVAFAGEGDTLVHSTVSCGGVLTESWAPGTRAAPLRERLVAVRRLEPR